MRVQTFVLFVILLSILMLLAVHQEVERNRSGYQAGKLLAEREELRITLAKASARQAELLGPERLAQLNYKLALGLRPLPPVMLSQPGR
ncbi:MAG: hypothetical protein JXA52_01015 [Planctomycetes bacterium]|nr:hypothetical protein [Planctomycetota bacterium]